MTGPLIASLAATATLAGWWWMTLTLPEPTPHPHDPEPAEPKRPYRELATWPHALVVGAASLGASLLVTWAMPATVWPVWLVLTTFGVGLAGVDGVTTWIPKVVSWASWAGLASALLVMMMTGGPWLAAIMGGVAAAVLFAGMWLGTGGALGFGDVRFIPLVGAPTMALGWPWFVTAMLVGSLFVLAHGIVRRLRGRPAMVPWAPGYLAGALVVAVLHAV